MMKKISIALLFLFISIISFTQQNTCDRIIKSLDDSLDYSNANNSFSPNYSDIGLVFDKQPGIQSLYFHYNRRSNKINHHFLTIPNAKIVSTKYQVLSVKQLFNEGSADYVFYDRNSWIVECKNVPVQFGIIADTGLKETRVEYLKDQQIWLFEAFVKTLDVRDPDKYFPIIIGVKLLKGEVKSGDGIQDYISFIPNEKGEICLSFTVNMLEINKENCISLLAKAPTNYSDAYQLSYNWFKNSIGNLNFKETKSIREEKILSLAAYSLAFNSCLAPGNLAGRVALFPSRGGYATHYLWDACFQNLATEYMEKRLAEDAMLLLTENMRVDGKMPHFICSTWMRPQDSQPPLVGWASLRLIKERNDTALARKILPALVKNTNWWLTQRMTRYGLISCSNPLETGWDNTPRLDSGAILPCDMNSYLLLQMQACIELAKMTGDKEVEIKSSLMAKDFSEKIMSVLYDKKSTIFRDVLISTGKPLKIITPANFMPLLTDIQISKVDAEKMIQDYLLNPKLMYGNIPFPSVSYNDAKYKASGWWRGPTWLSPAWFMLEVLQKYGFEKEHKIAAQRLYDMIIKDGRISELFNSQTGKGLGHTQQGWTAAIMLRIKMDILDY